MRLERIRKFFRWFYRYRSLRLTPEVAAAHDFSEINSFLTC